MLARTGLKYPSKLHCEKVASFLPHSARHEAIILAKGTEVQSRDNTDVELDFRQESNFYYLTGVLEADFYFIYDLSHGRSYLIAPNPDPLKAVWKGPSLSDKQLLERYNVDHVVRFSNLLDLLKHQLKPKHIYGWNSPEKVPSLGDQALERELEHYISQRLVHPKKDELQEPKPRPHPPHDHGPYGDHHGHRHRCRHGYPGGHHDHKHRHDPNHGHPGHDGPKQKPDTTLLEALIFARINKSPIEIALSRESTRISSDAHRLIMKSVRAGMYEYQLEALFRYECARQGGKTQAYLPIVGTGVNGAYLHYTRNDTRLKDGQLLLIDAACEADCYGSDITRTIPVNGSFTADQLAIYNLVLEMQTSVIRSMAQGVDWKQMHILSQKIGIRGLKRLGILKGEEDDLFESGVIKIFYPHGLGHLLGLNVHDDGLGLGIQLPAPKSDALKSLLVSKTAPVQFHSATADPTLPGGILPPPSSRRSKAMGSSLYATPATKLEPGMLLTVEPGIYFNPAQIEFALDTFYLAPYLDEPTLRRFMPVGGVRLEDVVLILPDGSVDNITTAPKDPREVEQIIQEGRREYQQSLTQDLGTTVAEKPTKINEVPLASEPPRGIKKRIGVFKKLLRAIRNIF